MKLWGAALVAVVLLASGCRKHSFARWKHGDRTAAARAPSREEEVHALIDAIADRWTSEGLGLAGKTSRRWALFRRLSRRIDRDAALAMLVDPRPAVRAWGAQYVIERTPEEAARVAPLLHDEATLRSDHGCIIHETTTVATLVSQIVARAGIAPKSSTGESGVDEAVDPPNPALRAFTEASVQDPSIAPRIRTILLGGLGPSSAAVVARAVEALIAIPGDHRPGAVEALRTSHVEHTTTLVRPLLSTREPETTWPELTLRLAAVHALSVSGDREAASLLLALTKDHDYEVRHAAVAGYVAQASADQALAAKLVEGVLHDHRPGSDEPVDVEAGSDLANDVAAIATARALDWVEQHPQGLGEGALRAVPPLPPPEACAWLRSRRLAMNAPPSGPDGQDDRVRDRYYALEDAFERCATRRDLPLLGGAASYALRLAVGDAAEIEPLLDDPRMRVRAADRLFWLGAKGSLPAIRAANAKRPSLEMTLIAEDLEGVRRTIAREHEPIAPRQIRISRVECSSPAGQRSSNVVDVVSFALTDCFDDALSLDPRAHGTVDVALRNDAHGGFASATPIRWTTSKPLALCTAPAIEEVASAITQDSPCTVRVEFVASGPVPAASQEPD